MAGPLAGVEIVADLTPRVIQVDTDVANSGNLTTTETVVHSVTGGLISGQIYRITLDTLVDTSVNGDSAAVIMREDSLTGTQIQGVTRTMESAAVAKPAHLVAYHTAVATADKTFVATMFRTAGTGNIIRSAASTNPSYLSIELTGL